MSRLVVHAETDPAQVIADTDDAAAIARRLAEVGVRFERWDARHALGIESDAAEILGAYAPEIARLKAEGGYVTADVIRLTPDNPDHPVLRRKFLDEHTHAEDEVRFFVEGEGTFYLHLGGRVFRTLCCRDDLISVPAGTPHWFDMGPAPRFAAIRLFTNPEGWVARFTGSPIAEGFPRHGE